MKGHVDERRRALIDISIRPASDSPAKTILAWIDTAFDGDLVLPTSVIKDLGLESLRDVIAVLADGKQVTLKTYLCYVDWFGELKPLQVIANEGQMPLVGTELLDGHLLQVDYRQDSVSLD